MHTIPQWSLLKMPGVTPVSYTAEPSRLNAGPPAICEKPRVRRICSTAVVLGDNGSADMSRPMEDRGDSGRWLNGDSKSEGSPAGLSL